VLDAKMDDDALEQQFSAITLNEQSAVRTEGNDSIVVIVYVAVHVSFITGL
jgi:hypothetical protein